MKVLIYFFLFFKILTVTVNAEIAFIDINYILNNSDVGKSLNSHLDKINKKHIQTFQKIENALIKKEKVLIAQQNVINELEFKKKINILSEEVKKYRNDKNKSKEDLNKIKILNTKKIFKMINPIITNYVENNAISLVIPKKNIIVGKKKLDITNKILEILNNQHSSIVF
tara:strand:- start:1978 stop:2487 length:510 start_codon:yes stop_codon:yes gene_type:complete